MRNTGYSFLYTLDDWGNRTNAAETLNVPLVAVLLSLADSATTADRIPTFDWSDVAGATQYNIQVDDDAGFSSLAAQSFRVTTAYISPTALPDAS